MSSATAAGRRTAQAMEVHFLAELPLDPQIRAGGDSGNPVALKKGEGGPFHDLAQNTVERLREVSQRAGPKIEISE